ncbi:MAG: thioredoxin-dependent thiol peroxidase [Flavipsychrobacter sp.]|nr:thioredoxin-dependent thiol peroxidase [Flavipsychrobacter sp.]
MTLNAGDKAPDFKAKDQNGKEVSLSALKGKKVVLYFYPKDDTPGCTAEACNLRDNFAALKAKGVVILGVSTDSEKSHKKFEDKYSLPFTLVSDEDKAIVNEYGLWGEKKFMGKAYMGTTRATFLINEEGVIDHVINKVDTKNHTEQILELWGI